MQPGNVFLCCAYGPRCFVIHKVTPKSQGLNPNANVFQSKTPSSSTSESLGQWEYGDDGSMAPTNLTTATNITIPPSEGDHQYMNGDLGKMHSTVYSPNSDSNIHVSEFTMNGGINNGIPVVSELFSVSSDVVPAAQSSLPVSVFHGAKDKAVMEEKSQKFENQSLENNLPQDELKSMLQQQLEYYFSRENLASDTYLVSQMDSDQYVPIWTVANFNQIKKLTSDINLVVEVLRESPNVQVDETGEKVRPNHKRCIVILREIPEMTPLEEVRALFSGENCPKIVSCEFAHNSSWYVTFESDEDAQRAYRYLREEVKAFQGKPIMARIKAKPITRASFAPKNGYRAPTIDPSLYLQQQRYPYPPSPGIQHQPLPFNGPQVEPFHHFYPPNMIQAWTPTSPPYFDLGTVFAMNGFAPQATYKPNATANRHNFPMPRSRNKSYANFENCIDCNCQRPQVDLYLAFPQNPKGHPRLQSNHDIRQLHERHLLNENPVVHRASPRTSDPYWETNHSRLEPSSPHPSSTTIASTSATASHSQEGKQDSHSQTSVQRPIDFQVKDQTAQPQRVSESGQPSSNYEIRHRRRRRDEDGANKTARQGFGQPNNPKENKSPSPKFDLETASFPPLPGTVNTAKSDSEIFENRMADIVKGTAKPATKDSKTQTPLSPTTKDSSTLTNGDVVISPSSPSKVSKATSTADKSTKTDEPAVINNTLSKVHQPSTGTQTLTSTTNPIITSSVEEKPMKLSYAQMAQRAKEKVEKLAQEQKEKQEQIAKERSKEMALATTNKAKDLHKVIKETQKFRERDRLELVSSRNFRRARAQKENDPRDDRCRDTCPKSPQ